MKYFCEKIWIIEKKVVTLHYQIKRNKNMTLLEKLQTETATLKAQYVSMTAEYAKTEFAKMIEDGLKNLHVQFNELHGKYFKRNFGKTKSEDARISKTVKYLNEGEENFVITRKKEAEEHYQYSIEKLAERLKKLNFTENTELKTSHVGVNIETIAIDNGKKVKAHTIIASGPIQRPHYRYLVNSIK